MFNLVIPVFSQLLASYNATLSHPDTRDRQLRVRVVMHTGNVHHDENGCYGEALDVAFRLLDAPRVKTALKQAQGPVLVVVSGGFCDSAAPHGSGGTGRTASRLVIARVAGHEYQGWIHIPPKPPGST